MAHGDAHAALFSVCCPQPGAAPSLGRLVVRWRRVGVPAQQQHAVRGGRKVAGWEPAGGEAAAGAAAAAAAAGLDLDIGSSGKGASSASGPWGDLAAPATEAQEAAMALPAGAVWQAGGWNLYYA